MLSIVSERLFGKAVAARRIIRPNYRLSSLGREHCSGIRVLKYCWTEVRFLSPGTRLKRILKQFLVILLLSSAPVLNAHAKERACDFARYKPLVLSDVALVEAAIKKAEPKYPSTGSKVRVQGDVRVKVLVDRKGNVTSACAINGHPLLRPSAIRAAIQWKFNPNFGLFPGQRRRYIQSFIVFNFRLDAKR
jgi:TonB family protein